MKYIILPIFRFILILAMYLIAYPILIFITFLIGCWEGHFNEFKSIFKLPFMLEDYDMVGAICESEKETYYYYKTPLDYLFQNKRYISKEERYKIE